MSVPFLACVKEGVSAWLSAWLMPSFPGEELLCRGLLFFTVYALSSSVYTPDIYRFLCG